MNFWRQGYQDKPEDHRSNTNHPKIRHFSLRSVISNHLQRDALIKEGVDVEYIFEEKVTGTKADRPKLKKLLSYARLIWNIFYHSHHISKK